MGFGTFFIGYFFLLNLTYFGFTDALAALIMALGLYKLSTVNRYFKLALVPCAAFALLGFAELILQIISMFDPSFALTDFTPYTNIARYLILAILSSLSFMGMRDVALEVGLKTLSEKCKRLIPFTATVFVICMLLEAPGLLSFLPTAAIAWVALVAIIALIFVYIVNLSAIYSCYAKICLPEEQNMPIKESRFGFVNEYRKRQAQKNAEYAKYRIEKAKNKAQNKKGKKK